MSTIPAFVNSASVPDIVTHLKTAFDADTTIPAKTLDAFIAFAKSYMDQHRVIELFYPDGTGNIGMCLSNNVRVTTTTDTISGTMQPSEAVSISVARSQPGQNGVSATSVNAIF
jgi:hypothetical protein